jgi:hypothetical protein
MGKVFIVGTAPKIAPDFGVEWTHVPVEDKSSWPACNINACLLAACQVPQLSDTFLRVDDDTFFLRAQDADTFPNYYRGLLPEHVQMLSDRAGSLYYKSLLRTVAWLNARQVSNLDFEVHGPMRFEKAKLGALLARLKPETGFLSRSLYGNLHNLAGEPMSDSKIDLSLSPGQIERRVKDRPFFSVGDLGLTHAMRTFLGQIYPGRVP